MTNQHFLDFGSAIIQFEKALTQPKTEYLRDSCIKRFEICFDLSWKSIQVYVRKQGLECRSPRACFKTGFQLELISNDQMWLNMIDDRNLAADIYSFEYAEELYQKLPTYLPLLQGLAKDLSSKTQAETV